MRIIHLIFYSQKIEVKQYIDRGKCENTSMMKYNGTSMDNTKSVCVLRLCVVIR